ncbi:response regulator [Limnoraphis robusta]|uniref:response regulator n=1 Tax=Limnoraphis robusta TaxID=1118279 RepID=UPI002B221195|nr:response regulator [Limnoraphis robusta]MEA5496359.1 response regulator [Limnoraphis robusta BA-68 BA1]
MWQLLENIFSPKQYMPHGSCYLWQSPLIWLHIISDFLIAIAYFSIPAMLIYFVYQRRDIPFNRVFILFGVFIISCGLGHLLDIWTLWHPAYWLSGIERAFTALISCYTALELMVLLPQFLSLKTPEQLAEVEAVSNSKSLFLAHMSHELRTPLSAILGFTELMSRDVSLSINHSKYINIINRAGEHLLALINDILEMSKIEAGQAKLREDNFDLYSQINSLEEMLRLKAQSKGLKLVFKRDAEVPQHIYTDEGKLRQVLINLLSNAIKFTEQGSVTLRVKSQEFKPLNNPHQIINLLTFEVSDTGPGIAPEEQHKLFEVFSQTETGIKSGQGTGLGLPISQKFVQLMGGEITVSSKLNEGTLFAFSIPVKTVKASKIETTQTSQKVTGLAASQPKFRILITDDNPQNCCLLMQLLSSIGFEVQEAANGQEALEIWSSWKPDLIFMDMKMPVMDGYTAIQNIRAYREGKATVIIALTAQAFEEERQSILSIGCDDFIRKPFQQQEILAAINRHLKVEYSYQEKLSKENHLQDFYNQDLDVVLNAEDLEIMPREWIEQLSEFSAQCSDLLILQLIEQIPATYSHLTTTLTKIVDEFRYDKIFELTQFILDKETSENQPQPDHRCPEKC